MIRVESSIKVFVVRRANDPKLKAFILRRD